MKRIEHRVAQLERCKLRAATSGLVTWGTHLPHPRRLRLHWLNRCFSLDSQQQTVRLTVRILDLVARTPVRAMRSTRMRAPGIEET
jgi:Ni,Fe-hydrogenase I large subunit